jgi:hypothetical protein
MIQATFRKADLNSVPCFQIEDSSSCRGGMDMPGLLHGRAGAARGTMSSQDRLNRSEFADTPNPAFKVERARPHLACGRRTGERIGFSRRIQKSFVEGAETKNARDCARRMPPDQARRRSTLPAKGEPVGTSALGHSRPSDAPPAGAACPLSPSKRTSRACLDMFVQCHQRP